jgi:hypothetical protein
MRLIVELSPTERLAAQGCSGVSPAKIGVDGRISLEEQILTRENVLWLGLSRIEWR